MAVRRVKIRWRLAGFEELRRDPKVGAMIGHEVDAILSEADTSKGYAGGVESGRSRTRGYVVTTSVEAYRDNARNHTLLRALAGRAVTE